MTMTRILALLPFVLVLGGCAGLPPMPPAPPALPAGWRHAPEGEEPGRDWWRAFGSDELERLAARAGTGNLDLAGAMARVRQARAAARMAGSALWPEAAGGVDVSRQGSLKGGRSVNATGYGVLLDARYEVDLWGGNRAGRDAALADLRATVFGRDAVGLAVTAAVAASWLEAVALRQRIGIAEGNLQNAGRLLALVESRGRAGAAAPLELAQQRGMVAAQRRTLASLRQQEESARTELAVLLGQAGGVEIGLDTLAGLTVPAIGAGLPSHLLARRPDVARAEALLAAADADVTAARAAMLPGLTLTGGLGAEGHRLLRVLDNPLYALAAGVTAPVFNADRLAAGRDLAMARREELLAGYRQAIVDAVADVEVALNAVTRLDAQAALQAEELAQAQRALTLAESRYGAGAETLLTLLDAQRTLYAAQDEAVRIKLARLVASVALYKALGGGWRVGKAGDGRNPDPSME